MKNQIYAFIFLLGMLWGTGCREPVEPIEPIEPTPTPEPVAEAPEPEPIPLLQEVVTAEGRGEAVAVSNRLRLASYNIQNFTDGEDDGWYRTTRKVERHVANAARAVEAIQADVLVVQEIENEAILQRLNEALERPFAELYITRFDETGRNSKLNIALLSRVPVLNVEELDFSAVTESPVHLSRGAIRFQIELGEDRRLLGYGVHLKSNFGEFEENVEKRLASTAILRADANAVMAVHPGIEFEAVLLGDMNVDPAEEKWAEDASLSPFDDWNDLWDGVPLDVRTTHPERQGDPELSYPPVAFDRIIVHPALSEAPWTVGDAVVVREGLDLGNIYVDPGENDLHASDHYPIYADLLLSSE